MNYYISLETIMQIVRACIPVYIKQSRLFMAPDEKSGKYTVRFSAIFGFSDSSLISLFYLGSFALLERVEGFDAPVGSGNFFAESDFLVMAGFVFGSFLATYFSWDLHTDNRFFDTIVDLLFRRVYCCFSFSSICSNNDFSFILTCASI